MQKQEEKQIESPQREGGQVQRQRVGIQRNNGNMGQRENQEKATTSGVMHERYQVSKQGHGKAGEVVQKGTTIRTGNSFSTFGDHQQEDGYKEGNYGRGYESNRKKG